jgi:hypothetical protein
MVKVTSEIYVVGRFSEIEHPFIKIQLTKLRNSRVDIRISFIGTHHHYSLHEAKILKSDNTKYLLNLHNEETEFMKSYAGEKPIVFTSFDLDKQRSTWDEEIMKIATKLNLDPVKHTKYYINTLLPLGGKVECALGGRRIRLNQKNKYPKDKCYIFDVGIKDFWIEAFFTTGSFIEHKDMEFDVQIGKIGLLLRGEI